MKTLEEFQVYFWSYISENIVTNSDRVLYNNDFCELVCYDCYRLYTKSGANIDVICKLAESILSNVQKFKPNLGS